MMKQVKAMVNGKVELVKVAKSYNSGTQEVFEGTMNFNGQQVWVAVAASEIVKDVTPKARLKAEYKGDREDATCRGVEFTVTAKTKQDAEGMMAMLDEFMSGKGYEMARCSNVEEFNGTYTAFDSVYAEDPTDGKTVLELYKDFKKMIKGA